MRKGQLSFDFVIAMSFLILFLQSFVAFADGLIFDQDMISIKAQQGAIISQIEQTILNGNVISGADAASINYSVPEVSAPSGRLRNSCFVSLSPNAIGGTTITSTVDFEGIVTVPITKDVSHSNLNFSPGNNIDCGGTLTLSKP